MKNIFIILGYGIPKDILKDEQYKRYIGLIFNYIYQCCLDKKERKPLIIFCGGKTDIFKPYKRTEAGEMKRLFLALAQRYFVEKYTKDWQYKLKKNSLSTVENIMGAHRMIKQIHDNKSIYIFVEYTRIFKIKTFAKKIIKKNFKIISIDFDLSINRYRDPEFIKEKEARQTEIELNVLKNAKFYKKYRQFLEDKIRYFRQVGPKGHAEAIYNWWQEKLKELENYK